jgi:hypothetical protein
MKKTLFALTCALAFLATSGNAYAVALSTSDSTFLGTIDPSEPANEESEVILLNFLLDMGTGTSQDDVNLDPPPGPQLYDFDRSSNPCVGPCEDAVAAGAFSLNTGSNTDVDLTNWTYVYAKYGGTAYVWDVSNLNAVWTIPANLAGEQNALSHFALFNPTTTQVPDGGATLSLLGLGLVGLGYLRARKA